MTTWNSKLLKDLAVQENKAFLDLRMDRLYLAICRDEGNLQEHMVPAEQALQELNAALDAVPEQDIKRLNAAARPMDTIFGRMLERKEQRSQAASPITKQAPSQSASEQSQDAEPQQGG